MYKSSTDNTTAISRYHSDTEAKYGDRNNNFPTRKQLGEGTHLQVVYVCTESTWFVTVFLFDCLI
jgi:hypothetical protein